MMKNERTADAQRSEWLGVMSRSHPGELESLASSLTEGIELQELRQPQVGLVMVRGRAGGSGSAFNLGEMTMSRASVRLTDGTVGHGYAQGRDKRQAKMAAILDALLQTPKWHDKIMDDVILPLGAAARARRREASRRAAATRVNFFTLAHGEDAE